MHCQYNVGLALDMMKDWLHR